MADFEMGNFQLPADFEKQMAAYVAANGGNFAVPNMGTPTLSQGTIIGEPRPPQPTSFAVPQMGAPEDANLPEAVRQRFAVANAPGGTTMTDLAPQLANAAVPNMGPPQPTNFFVPRMGPNDYTLPTSIAPADAVIEQGMPGPTDIFAVQMQNASGNKAAAGGSQPSTPDFSVMGDDTPPIFKVKSDDSVYPNAEAAKAVASSIKYAASPDDKAAAMNVAVTGGGNVDTGVKINPQGLTDPNVATVTASPTAKFDYSALSSGEPQLQPATAQYGTPYYAAYTNDGDLAGAVMVAPTQKIRMVDSATGDVVFEGAGPEGAKQAVALANEMSRTKGRTAAWKIEAQNEQGGYTTQAAERYDPKKQNTLGKLADFALPILGVLLMPVTGGMSAALAAGLGAAAGSAVSSIAQGRSLQDTVLRAAASGIGAGVIGPAAGKAFSSLTSGAGAGAGAGAANTVANKAADVLGSKIASTVAEKGAEGTIEELVITGMSRAAATALVVNTVASGAGGALGNAINPSALNQGARGDTVTGDEGQDILQGGNKPIDLSEVVVTAPKLAPTTTPFDAAFSGVGNALPVDTAPTDTAQNTKEPPKKDTEVSEVVITPAKPVAPVPGLVTTDTANELLRKALAPATLFDAIKTGDPTKITDWVKDHPWDAAQAAIALTTLANGGGGGPKTSSSGGGGTYNIPTGPGGAPGTGGPPGTRGSLSSIFGAALPAASPQFAARQPRDMSGVDWMKYGMGPERSFFNNVPQGAADRLAVPLTPSATPSVAAPPKPTSTPTTATFSAVQNRLAQEMGRPFPPEGKRYIQRDDGVIMLVDDNPEATYVGRSGKTKKVRDLSTLQGGFTTKAAADFAAANTPEVIAALRGAGQLPMKRGGRAQFAVQGNGDGREDLIPAKLSDGEYVIDAETVALLGNGSSKAGAAKLDQFRVNVRKHKGRDLARGKFSVNAKRPEAYLAGGQTR